MINTDRFDKAIQKFDDYNSNDPHREPSGNTTISKELLYAERMSLRLSEYKPASEEYLRLAVRCQHIGRWEIPRNTYPEGKKGYIAWRNKLKDHHAAIAGSILESCGYDKEMIGKVQDLLEKKDLRSDQDTKTLEDVICMVFVEYYLDDFAAKHDDAKVLDILTKTLKKMTPEAIAITSSFNLSKRTQELLAKVIV